MPDKKLTDSDIIKALGCCADDTDDSCQHCPLKEECYANAGGTEDIKQLALDLINRLQAENERLCQIGGDLLSSGSKLFQETKVIKAEAVKEFAEKLLSCYKDFDDANEEITLSCLKKTIEDCLKEKSNA